MAVYQAAGQRDGRLPGSRPARWPFARHPARTPACVEVQKEYVSFTFDGTTDTGHKALCPVSQSPSGGGRASASYNREGSGPTGAVGAGLFAPIRQVLCKHATLDKHDRPNW